MLQNEGQIQKAVDITRQALVSLVLAVTALFSGTTVKSLSVHVYQ